jgi:SAM-dependent methyltransferase
VNTYQRLHARLYDVIYADKPYGEEAGFVARQLPGPPGPLLDLACGTARHAAAFAGMGYTVTGVDYSPDLLERARENVAGSEPAVELIEHDMRELDLGREFAAVTCLFDSIGYPQTDEGVIAALSSARRHLAPGGVLAVEYLHGPAMVKGFEPLKVRRWETPDGGRLVRISNTILDSVRGLMQVDYELIELRADGTYEQATETQRNRVFTVDEFDALVREAGLRPLPSVTAYSDDPTITTETFHVLATAEAA